MEDKEHTPGMSWFDKALLAINRVGFPTVVVGYFLYKDWYFTKDLIANQKEVILTQAQIITMQSQIADAIRKIAEVIK